MPQISLSSWQTTIWDDPHRFKVINVGRRSGKTVLSTVRMISEASEPNKIIWYVSPTYRQSKSIAWELLKQYTPTLGRPEWNETELSVKLKNKSQIILKGADNPDSLRGTRVDFIIFDEVAFFKDWDTTWQALRPILTDSQAPGWFVSTPNGLNHFYDLYQKNDPDYVSFHFTTYDNPYVAKEELEKMRLEMDEDQFRQEILAEFVRPSGSVYRDWPMDNFREVPYDSFLPVHISLDFGVNDPTAILWIQPSAGEFRVIDYEEFTDANIAAVAQIIDSKPYKKADLITGDDAGRARSITTGTSPIEELAKRGIHVKTTPGLRIEDQVRKTHEKIKSLYVDQRLTRFRDVLLNYRYPEKKSSLVNQSNEVPIHDQWSHGARALEYYFVNYSGVSNYTSTYDPQKWSIK